MDYPVADRGATFVTGDAGSHWLVLSEMGIKRVE